MSQSPADAVTALDSHVSVPGLTPTPSDTDSKPALQRYQSGWNHLNELLRKGGSLSGRERNCAYLNLGSQSEPRFADISFVSGFDGAVDGRGLAVVDWDRDGDLDLWTSNRTGPRLQYFRNHTSPQHHYIAIRLQGTTSNRDAIGARVEIEVEPAMGVLSQTVVAGDAYLSQSSKWLHFGLAESTSIKSVRVRWPGQSDFQEVQGVQLDAAYRIVQGQTLAIPHVNDTRIESLPNTGNARMDSQPHSDKQANDGVPPAASTQPSHPDQVVVIGRVPLPPIMMRTIEQSAAPLLQAGPTLVLLWSPECPVCLQELAAWKHTHASLKAAGLDIVALSIGDKETLETTHKIMEQTGFPFRWGVTQQQHIQLLEAYLAFLQPDYQRPLGVPMQLLLDPWGQVAVIYRGKVRAEQLADDLSVLAQSADELRHQRIPFPGTWLRPMMRPDPVRFASQLQERFGTAAAADYFEYLLQLASQPANRDAPYAISDDWQGNALHALGMTALSEGRLADAIRYSRRAQTLLPDDFRSFANEGAALLSIKRPREAVAALTRALELQPGRPAVLVNRAAAYRLTGQHQQAIADWETLLQSNPDDASFRLSAATLAFAIGDDRRAVFHYSEHLRRNADSVDALGALSWIVATSPDDDVRDGERALELADAWLRLTGETNFQPHNARAAALAEQGDFAGAVATMDKAIDLADQNKAARAVTLYRQRREAYRNRTPFRRKRVGR